MNVPRAARDRPSKWRTILLFWSVQTAVVYTLPLVILAESWPRLADIPDALLDDEWIRIGAPWAIFIALSQAAFVLPVHAAPPGPPSRIGRWARHAAAGMSIGMIAWWSGLFILQCLGESLGLEIEGIDIDSIWVLVGAPAACGAAATVVLRLVWRDRSPMGVTVMLAVTCCAALLIGLTAAGLELIELARGDIDGRVWAGALLAPLLLSWAVGTPLVLAFVRRGPREDRVRRLASRLFLGTVIELVAVIPLDVMVRRRTNCYCGEGTFWSLVLCGSVGFLTLGPGVWFLLGRRRRRWLLGRCEVCEYDMTGCMDAARCPECGAGWRPTASAPPSADRTASSSPT